jgi:hypothetical protein
MSKDFLSALDGDIDVEEMHDDFVFRFMKVQHYDRYTPTP